MTCPCITRSSRTRFWLYVATALTIALFLSGGLPAAQTAMADSPAVAAQSTGSSDWIWPTLRMNTTYASMNVRTVQYLLNARGANLHIDGVFGPKTDAAVRAFQLSHGLAVDGIVGRFTWSALLITVQRGDTGSAVMAAQDQLTLRGLSGDPKLFVDGIFGPKTQAAVVYFQSRMADLRQQETNGLESFAVDGIVGPQTWHALVIGNFRAG